MSAPPNRLRLVLFGEQRSGTTLLSTMLDAQPLVRVESGYLAGMMHSAFRELGISPSAPLSSRQRRVLWQRIVLEEAHRGVALPPAMPSALCTFDALHASMLERIARPEHVVIGHKVHGPIEALPRLLELPDVHCVFLIRDVRDMLLSRAHRGEHGLDEKAALWSKSAALVRRYAQHPRVLIVRFEDFVRSAEAELARIGDLLGVAMHVPEAPGAPGAPPELQNSSFGTLTAQLDTSTLERFRSCAGKQDESIVRFGQWRCRGELGAYGYPLLRELDPSGAERLGLVRRALAAQALALPRKAKHAVVAQLRARRSST